jgi:3-keto-L-gulonate-6-phosphate decarboxylase
VQKNAKQIKMQFGVVPLKPIWRKFRRDLESQQQGKRDLSLPNQKESADTGVKMGIAGGVTNANLSTLVLPVVVSGPMCQEEKDLEKERAKQKEKAKAKAKGKEKDLEIETILGQL